MSFLEFGWVMADMNDNMLDNMKTKQLKMKQSIDDLSLFQEKISVTARDSKEQLRKHFDILKDMINKMMDERVTRLEMDIDDFEKMTTTKIETFKKQATEDVAKIEEQLSKATELMKNGNMDEMKAFQQKSDNENQSSHYPSSLHHLSHFSLQLPIGTPFLRELKHAILLHGQISLHPLLIITSVSPRASSISIKWEQSYSEGPGCYLLQMSEVGAEGKITKCTDVYRGSESSYVVHRLKPNQEYSFRVTRVTVDSIPFWSIPRSISTLAPSLRWKEDNEICSLLNGDITLSTSSVDSVLYISNSRSYVCGHSLTMTIESAPKQNAASEDGFGLSMMEADDIRLFDKGTLFLTCQGVVCVDSQKMTTRLPCIREGSTIIFYSEPLPNNKLRVTIEVEEKVVTFDWLNLADVSSLLEQKDNKLNFFAKLSSPGWIVTVE